MSYLSYHALLSLIPRKRALSISATLLLAVSLGMPARIVHASQPTATTARALENISTTRPCTAAALLHVLRGHSEGHGKKQRGGYAEGALARYQAEERVITEV